MDAQGVPNGIQVMTPGKLYRWTMIISALITSVFLLYACAPSPSLQPKWVDKPFVRVPQGIIVAGIGDPSESPGMASESAVEDALVLFLRHMGMEIRHVTTLSFIEKQGDPSFHQESQSRIQVQGFTKDITVLNRRVEILPDGRHIAWVQLLVPETEEKRIESERKRSEEFENYLFMETLDRLKSYEQQVQKAFIAADLDAVEKILPLYEQTFKSWRSEKPSERIPKLPHPLPLPPKHYLAELKAVVEIKEVNTRVQCKGETGTIDVLLSFQGVPQPGRMVSLVLPSGRVSTGVTGDNGIAPIMLPLPCHPGTYVLKSYPAFSSALFDNVIPCPIRITTFGECSGLSDGSFHDFIEVVGVGTAELEKASSPRHAEDLALTAARHFAFGALAQRVLPAQMSMGSYSYEHEISSEITRKLKGNLEAHVVEENVRWEDDLPVGEVILRWPAGKAEYAMQD